MSLASWVQAVQGRTSMGLTHVDAAAVAAASMLTRDARSSQPWLFILHLGCSAVFQASLGLQHVEAAAVAAASMLTRDARSSQLWLFILHLGCSAVFSGQFGPPACRSSCGDSRVAADS